MRETLISCLLYTPWLQTEPATQECARTRNHTSNLSLCGMTSNQLSHMGQGTEVIFKVVVSNHQALLNQAHLLEVQLGSLFIS